MLLSLLPLSCIFGKVAFLCRIGQFFVSFLNKHKLFTKAFDLNPFTYCVSERAPRHWTKLWSFSWLFNGSVNVTYLEAKTTNSLFLFSTYLLCQKLLCEWGLENARFGFSVARNNCRLGLKRNLSQTLAKRNLGWNRVAERLKGTDDSFVLWILMR